MLAVVHLSHLQNEFHIQRLLERSESASGPALLKVSADIVSVVLQLGKLREKVMLLRHEFPYVVINYGLPSAATLAAGLQRSAKHPTPVLPPSLSRSTLIRSLTVFASYLENIGEEGETSHATCVQAAQAISHAVDDMLDFSPVPTAPVSSIPSSSDSTLELAATNATTANITAPATQTPMQISDDILENPFSPSQFASLPSDIAGLPDFGIPDSNVLDGFNFSGWLNNSSWTTQGGG